MVTRAQYVVFEYCSGTDLFNFIVTGPFERRKRYRFKRCKRFSVKLDREVLHHSGLLENTLIGTIHYFDVGGVNQTKPQVYFDLLITTTLRRWAGENPDVQ